MNLTHLKVRKDQYVHLLNLSQLLEYWV